MRKTTHFYWHGDKMENGQMAQAIDFIVYFLLQIVFAIYVAI